MTIALWLLSLAVAGGLAYAVGFKRGRRSEDAKWVERIKSAKADAFAVGQRAEVVNRQWIAEKIEAERRATIHENRSAGAKVAAATRRRNREARG